MSSLQNIREEERDTPMAHQPNSAKANSQAQSTWRSALLAIKEDLKLRPTRLLFALSAFVSAIAALLQSVTRH
ncbi:hypothetical protein [Streptomyces sp. NPDC001037]|uniref:hypothetical protein n=1 Tax=Streptomyces sp. NPDC001037 TaxID=3364542 RepID=UPI0036AF73EF